MMRPRRALAFPVDVAKGVVRAVLAQALELRARTTPPQTPQTGIDQPGSQCEVVGTRQRAQVGQHANRPCTVDPHAMTNQSDRGFIPRV